MEVMFQHLKLPYTKESIKHTFRLLDEDNNGYLDFDEFAKFMIQI